ncbi:ANTAR domain-containing protein [Amycolatopsis thailandensis]|uniref:ANTAR domain-containing protein n=2 Tax=Amycolatopsis thailandensis TaxID=589330 RepID=A0A229SFZ1_9PSEU|nr:ANTAR domain-containing protein [Amycolatopsis thailandensis]
MHRPDPSGLIEQAKGMIMLMCTCDAEQAFAALREVSRHTQVTLHDVADVIVASGTRTVLTTVDEDTARRIRREVRLRIFGAFEK